MANVKDVKAKAAKVTLSDGVEREMKFTLNAMAELEDRYGTIDKAFEALSSNSIKAIRLVLWAGLLYSDETLTEQQVGNLIDVSNMEAIVATLSEAFGTSLPEEATAANPNA